jgi:hypothetical protein
MDFVDGLPPSGSANSVLVVVDKFSKYAHFLPLRHPYMAASVARVFMDNIFKLHGLPVAIIFDWERVFTSKFWQMLFQLADTELRMSTTYHPQSDGQDLFVLFRSCLSPQLVSMAFIGKILV